MNRCLLALLLLLACGAAPATRAATLQLPKNGRIRVAVVLTEGATMIDFAGPWEVFQDVMVPTLGTTMDEQMPFDLFTVGTSRDPIHISGGMTVVPKYTFADAPVPDVVVVGAQGGAPALADWLRKMRPQVRVLMSVCTGAFKLADAGLLDGKQATTHHEFYGPFRQRFPKVTLVPGKRYVQSDDVVFTAGGLSSGIDLALHVVALYFGSETAQRTATYMEYQGTGWKD